MKLYEEDAQQMKKDLAEIKEVLLSQIAENNQIKEDVVCTKEIVQIILDIQKQVIKLAKEIMVAKVGHLKEASKGQSSS